MTLDEIIQNRISVRSYRPEKPSKDLILKVIEAARQAPSAVNKQPWRFVVIETEQKLAELQKAYNREWFATAPIVIAVIGNHSKSWHRADGKDHCDIDIAIATEHMALKATELGLGTCWVCNFDMTIVNAVLNVSVDEEVCVLLPIGYANAQAQLKQHQRNELTQIVSFC